MRSYLLGRMAPDDLPALEERFFVDSEIYEELTIVENELIDEYLRGELSPSDRESFEAHFMSAPERNEKMRFARALRKAANAESAAQAQEDSITDQGLEAVLDVAEPPPKSRPFTFLPFQTPIVSYALAALLLLGVVGVSWLVWKSLRTREPGNVLAVVLTPGLTRDEGGETKRIVVPADTGTVRLQLLLTNNQYQVYEATLLDSDGRTLTKKAGLKPQPVNPPALYFDVPAGLLPRGDYRVKLSEMSESGNTEGVGNYSLRVLGP